MLIYSSEVPIVSILLMLPVTTYLKQGSYGLFRRDNEHESRSMSTISGD